MFAALGSCASITHIQEKSSACVEVLRKLAHEMSLWFGINSFNRAHSEVSINADILALCLDISVQNLHTFTHNRVIQLPTTKSKKTTSTTKKSAVRDVLADGMQMLTEKSMYEHWLKRTGASGADLYDNEGDEEGGVEGAIDREGEVDLEGPFADPEGRMDVDPGQDQEFELECPLTDVNESSMLDE